MSDINEKRYSIGIIADAIGAEVLNEGVLKNE